MAQQQGDYDYLIPSETTQENPNWRSGIIPVQGYYRSRTLIRNRSDGPDIPKPSYAHGMFLQSQSIQKVQIPRNTDAEAIGNYIKGIWTGIWSFVTNPHVDYGTGGGGGTSIPDAIKAREDLQEIMRRNDRPPTQ